MVLSVVVRSGAAMPAVMARWWHGRRRRRQLLLSRRDSHHGVVKQTQSVTPPRTAVVSSRHPPTLCRPAVGRHRRDLLCVSAERTPRPGLACHPAKGARLRCSRDTCVTASRRPQACTPRLKSRTSTSWGERVTRWWCCGLLRRASRRGRPCWLTVGSRGRRRVSSAVSAPRSLGPGCPPGLAATRTSSSHADR
jgi:hypothetical protein